MLEVTQTHKLLIKYTLVKKIKVNKLTTTVSLFQQGLSKKFKKVVFDILENCEQNN